jgi:hypothetical protein
MSVDLRTIVERLVKLTDALATEVAILIDQRAGNVWADDRIHLQSRANELRQLAIQLRLDTNTSDEEKGRPELEA